VIEGRGFDCQRKYWLHTWKSIYIWRYSRSRKGRWAPQYSSALLADRLIRTISASFSASSRGTAAVDLVHHLVTLCSRLTDWVRTDCVICIYRITSHQSRQRHHHLLAVAVVVGVCGLVVRVSNSLLSDRGFESHCRPYASNFEQVDNLRCAQVNPASYPSRDGKWVVACGLWGEGYSVADWGGGMSACCTAGPIIR